jgi:hypothetical protein
LRPTFLSRISGNWRDAFGASTRSRRVHTNSPMRSWPPSLSLHAKADAKTVGRSERQRTRRLEIQVQSLTPRTGEPHKTAASKGLHLRPVNVKADARTQQSHACAPATPRAMHQFRPTHQSHTCTTMGAAQSPLHSSCTGMSCVAHTGFRFFLITGPSSTLVRLQRVDAKRERNRPIS